MTSGGNHFSDFPEKSTYQILCRLNSIKCIATASKFVTPRPRGKNWAWPWARETPQNLGFPFNISATTEDSNFKIGRLVGFAKAHHKIPPISKEGRNPKLGELPKIGFSLNIYAMAESIDFKFGTQSGWPIRPIIKSHK